MENFFRLTLFLSAIVNLLPAIAVFFPSMIISSYGIELHDQNLELVLRHRAVLFLIIGATLMYSAITRRFYVLVTVIGLTSMVSFILLYLLIGSGINALLQRVMWIDVGASILLIAGTCSYYYSKK